jgi:hypothetical protein
MDRNIAYCGEDCSICPAYIATIRDDDQLRNKVIEDWSHIGDFSKVKIDCVGCKSNGPIFEPCSGCKIKKCCEDKKLDDCSFCPELDTCSKLTIPKRKNIYLRITKMRDDRI